MNYNSNINRNYHFPMFSHEMIDEIANYGFDSLISEQTFMQRIGIQCDNRFVRTSQTSCQMTATIHGQWRGQSISHRDR